MDGVRTNEVSDVEDCVSDTRMFTQLKVNGKETGVYWSTNDNSEKDISEEVDLDSNLIHYNLESKPPAHLCFVFGLQV